MSEMKQPLTSIWQLSSHDKPYPHLTQDIDVDIAIVGGGITGLTSAYLLAESGKQVAVLDATSFGRGTTGHSTAKLTVQHDFIYDELLSHVGKEKAQQYYQSQNDALAYVRKLVKDKQIECGFSDEDTYLYATTHHGEHRLKREKKAYEQLAIPHEWVTELPINLTIRAALKVPNQAQFHPLAYISFLCDELNKKGAQLFEHTVCQKVSHDNGSAIVHTKDGHTVTAKKVIAATHFPFIDGGGLYMTRLKADRSYVVAGTTSEAWAGGMYLSAEQPKRSLRSAEMNGKTYILVGGDHHKAGQGMDARNHYDALRTFADEQFSNFTAEQEWSAQDLTTLDNIPYIGPLSSLQKNVFIATGYRKWGMTGGICAAQVLTDLIVDGNSLYSDLYKPMRFHSDPSIKHFLTENADVAKHLIQGKVQNDYEDVTELENGQGAVVKHDGKRAGAFKDERGNLHLVDTTCTHMGCECNWNHADLTWDCPCHGSRFSYKGEVIEGPAKEPLKKLD
ncbi:MULTISPECIES: FAD-dependent oxidoreductase [Shouchella]|uniref:FAD-dependent oxidoreductase n=2 Tax=Shouchella TaxID=2893057 RepID=A0ABY7W9L1_9BACI|nr:MULTISPECIES: FAD-dependent oxidoreductase [Shouchella]MED4128217.1 FAD-dependent oxidoreductase [Shouchella miscanthi]WDF05139.1 FAD-dependent oxidoreductase [Shouchella hunanensis]